MNQSCRGAGNRCWRSRWGCGNSAPASLPPDLRQCRVQGEHSRVPGVPWGAAGKDRAATVLPAGSRVEMLEMGVGCRAL